MSTLALTALIVVCLSIGAIIGLAVATIIQINKGEDDDANYIERQAALTQQQEAEPVLFALSWPSDGSRNQINSSTVFHTQEAAEDFRGRCSDHHTISVTPLYIHPPKPAAQPQPTGDERSLQHLGDEIHNASCTVIHLNEEIGEHLGRLASELWDWEKTHPPAAQPHWTDNHIKHESESGSWYAYDEVGLTYGTYETKDEARDALVIYEATQLHPAAQPANIDADELSNFIRKIDGNHSMGAGALAENIVEWIGKQAAQPQVPEGIVEKYNELIYHVASIFPNETRHETALRYIKDAEAADAAFFLCPFCRYRMETDDAYGCPNCLGEGLDGDDQGEGCLPDKEQS